MSEQQDVIEELEAAGVLNGVRWAYRSAVTRSLEDYSEGAGHDAAWLGNTRFTLFRNRLDRVFTCEHYSITGSGEDDADVALDRLFEELPKEDIRTMPRLGSGLVRRADLNGSPGWTHAGRRFLLASCKHGEIDRLPWPRRSPTKRSVARQRNPEPAPTLFDGLDDEEAGGLEVLGANKELDLPTFAVAHSLDPVTGAPELVYGRPRLNAGGGNAWHWYENLLSVPPIKGGYHIDDDSPLPAGPSTVADAEVRLRRPAEELRRDRASGEQ
ncbi:hypothetical protein [Frankia sp. Cj5]|uniref:hypothetical protein n=1 Tax=Frankia sp. Cj5 TaxID=2880978 RepID=UPI001EF535B0|nr:hypothetical protein [Frankia sp. Cj5]